MLEQAKKLFTNVLDLVALTVEEVVERYSGNSREDLQERLQNATDRGAELALEKFALEDKIGELRCNGPSLWSDEVELLQQIISTMQENIRANGFEDLVKAGKNLQIMQHLLNRCDHMPMTADEMAELADRAVKDCNVGTWDDVGDEIDDPYEGSWREAADNEGARIASQKDDDDTPF